MESLKKLMEAEQAKRKLARLNNANQRHSQFGGTFTRVTMVLSLAMIFKIFAVICFCYLNESSCRVALKLY